MQTKLKMHRVRIGIIANPLTCLVVVVEYSCLGDWFVGKNHFFAVANTKESRKDEKFRCFLKNRDDDYFIGQSITPECNQIKTVEQVRISSIFQSGPNFTNIQHRPPLECNWPPLGKWLWSPGACYQKTSLGSGWTQRILTQMLWSTLPISLRHGTLMLEGEIIKMRNTIHLSI